MKRITVSFLLFTLVFLFLPFVVVRFFPKSVPASVTPMDTIPETITVLQSKTGNVIEIPLEESVEQILAHEAIADAPIEAWKAQAVATRSYLLHKLSAPTHSQAMLCDDANHCVNLSSHISESILAAQATSETAGEYLAFEGQPAKACYFHVSAGKTESSMDVWDREIPYLVSVASEADVRASKYQSKVIYPLQALKTALHGAKKIDVASSPIGEVCRSEIGHVKSMILYGTSFSGHELKDLFHLNSTNFSLTLNNEQAIFEVKGDGHGVGMSKYGAKYMAESGENYQNILSHYYPGTVLITQK